MKRREFLKDTLIAGAGAILVSGGILAIGNRNAAGKNQTTSAKAFQPKNYKTALDPSTRHLFRSKAKIIARR
jgi:hypothetical protein